MSEEEIEALLIRHGWYLSMVKRHQTYFAYAKRKIGNRGVTRYIKTERKFNELTPSMIEAKIRLV